MKAKTAMWKSSDGVVQSFREMDTEHLQNLAGYLNRRLDEYSLLRERASARNCVIPPLSTQGATVQEWFDLAIAELNRRQLKEIKRARTVVSTFPTLTSEN
jgi:hypothetical protein